MDAKSKTGPGAPRKQTERTGKKEAVTPRKANTSPVPPPRKNNPSRATPPPEEAPPPAAPAAEQPTEDTEALEQDQTTNHQSTAEGAKDTEPKKHCMDCLKPLLIGGAVVAAAAILVGAFMVTRRH